MADEVEQEESQICFICFDEVINQITAECGHIICIPCLRKITSPPLYCPLCLEFSQLKTLQHDIVMYPEGESMCAMHREDRKLFCESEETLLCLTCSKSEDHGDHFHWPIAIAALRYRKRIEAQLEILHRNVKKVQNLLLKEKEQPLAWAVVCILQKETKRKTFQGKFQQIWGFLKRKNEKSEKEKFIIERENKKFNELYERLKEMEATQEHRILEEKEAWEATMSSQSTLLTAMIIQLEEKMQKPDVEMLQDVAETLERNFVHPNLEPFDLTLDTSYVTVVTEFLKVFQRLKLWKGCHYYDLSEEKKRSIRIFPGFSGKTYIAYITGSVEAETIKQRAFVLKTSSLDTIVEEEEFARTSTTSGNDI